MDLNCELNAYDSPKYKEPTCDLRRKASPGVKIKTGKIEVA